MSGAGESICGPKTITVTDQDGNRYSSENFALMQADTQLLLSVSSAAQGRTTSETVEMTVMLDRYPSIGAFKHSFAVEYRIEEVFEVTPEFELEPMIVNCDQEAIYALPPLFSRQGERWPYEVVFDDSSSEFALYDPESQYIWSFNWLLKESNEGEHSATVSVTYGEGEIKESVVKQL